MTRGTNHQIDVIKPLDARMHPFPIGHKCHAHAHGPRRRRQLHQEGRLHEQHDIQSAQPCFQLPAVERFMGHIDPAGFLRRQRVVPGISEAWNEPTFNTQMADDVPVLVSQAGPRVAAHRSQPPRRAAAARVLAARNRPQQTADDTEQLGKSTERAAPMIRYFRRRSDPRCRRRRRDR